jgi:quinol monooxygenase YgiN
MKTDNIITHVELTINPDFLDEVLSLAEKTREFILLEDGCESFTLMRKSDESNVLVIFAIYTSRQIYDWHLDQEYIKTFFAFLEGKLMAKPRMCYLEAL